MKKIKLVLIVVLSISLVLLIAQNTTQVRGRFLWLTTDVPLILLLILTASGAFMLGLLVAIIMKNSADNPKRSERRRTS